MSTLRINNIEAQSIPASPTLDEKVKITNSSGDILVNIDGKTSGITTIGINTTDGNIKFDANSNVLITGILTATTLAGNFTPDSLEIGSNIKLGNAGVITATSFVGGLPITNGADNRVITASSASAIQGESTLTYDGNKLKFGGGTRALDNGYYDDIVIDNSDTASGETGGVGISLISGNQSWCGLIFGDVDEHQKAYIKYSNQSDFMQIASADHIRFDTNSGNGERLRIASDGQLKHTYDIGSNGDAGLILDTDDATKASSILFRANNESRARIDVQRLAGDGAQLKIQVSQMNNSNTMLDAMTIAPVSSGDTTPDVTLTGNLVVANGHGIDFSATPNGYSGTLQELLDDYEEGYWTPTVGGWSASGTGVYGTGGQKGRYTKIGNTVTVFFHVYWTGLNNASGVFAIESLPFPHASNAYNLSTAVQMRYVDYSGDTVFAIGGHDYSSSLLFYAQNDNGNHNYVAVDTNGGRIEGCVTYLTDS